MKILFIMVVMLTQQLRKHLAPTGTLRVAINLSNSLLVTGNDPIVPVGVAPDVASLLADFCQLPLKLVPFPHPETICESAEEEDVWDVALIGADPLRANRISFTQPYCEIQACFMTRQTYPINCIKDIDKPNKQIVTKGGGAYDLWLQQHLKHATIIREKTIVDSFQRFRDDHDIDALAGLRSLFLDKKQHLPKNGVIIADWNFMCVQQSIGIRKRDNDDKNLKKELLEICNLFVKKSISDDVISSLIGKYNVKGKLFPSKL